jgi:DNA-binding LacI/PurR family transcriptional regulator
VGIRDIARHLGVSLMAVSLALRNSSRVSAATKVKVKKAAEELGYRPDPEVARLMSRLRQAGTRKADATIALMDISVRDPKVAADRYFTQVVGGAQERAEALGFRVTRAFLGEMQCGLPRMLGILYNRGVSGVVLLPPKKPMPLPQDLDWSKFALVSTTYAITPHVVNRVVPHQYLDMCRALKRLEKEGYRRIGIFFERDFEERTMFQFTAAIKLLGRAKWIFRVDSRYALNRSDVLRWVEDRKPEIILTPFADQLQPLLAEIPEGLRPKLYSVGVTGLPDVPYWDQRPHAIGAYAVNQLVGMIHYSERGLPGSPATTMLHGLFSDGLVDAGFF